MANIDLEMGQFQKVTTLENKDYIVVSLDNGTQGQIKVSDLASVVAAAGVGDALGIKRLDIYASKDTEHKINVKQNCYIFISSKNVQAYAMFYSPNYGDMVLSMIFGDTNVFSSTESSGYVFIKRANNELFLVNKKFDSLDFRLIVIEV